jgi:hypothetical protein
MFGNLIGILLGPIHPLSSAFKQMWTLMQSNIHEDLHVSLEYRAYVKHTHILQSLQLIFYSWFTHWQDHLTPTTSTTLSASISKKSIPNSNLSVPGTISTSSSGTNSLASGV